MYRVFSSFHEYTRPGCRDCLPDDVVEYLAELNERTYLWLELGLQSAHDETGRLINRAHDYDCYVEGVRKLQKISAFVPTLLTVFQKKRRK
ncbi:Putative protein ytqA [Listeria monocytogenes N53-1]|nr:Putative protein ytqA [Listeria monocytogenes N53-1]